MKSRKIASYIRWLHKKREIKISSLRDTICHTEWKIKLQSKYFLHQKYFVDEQSAEVNCSCFVLAATWFHKSLYIFQFLFIIIIIIMIYLKLYNIHFSRNSSAANDTCEMVFFFLTFHELSEFFFAVWHKSLV